MSNRLEQIKDTDYGDTPWLLPGDMAWLIAEVERLRQLRPTTFGGSAQDDELERDD